MFCQNHPISQTGVGEEITTERLAQIMLELQDQAAHNINLVTPLHFAPHIKEAVALAKDAGLTLPIVCNTGGFELASTIADLEQTIDIWLTDFKYADAQLARTLSMAGTYPQVATEALQEMVRQLERRGGEKISGDGIMQQGILVRHLVLPGHVDDSCAVLDRVWELAGNAVSVSIMNQYTPNARMRAEGGALARGVREEEYELVLCHADDLGFERIYWQEGGTVDESFIPAFDATGVHGPELVRRESQSSDVDRI